MKKLAAIIFLFPLICCGQKQGNIWFFGDTTGLDFNNGSPITLNNGQMIAQEGSSVISDSAGALLFYTNGVKVWNKNHQVMPNGDSLMGGPSSTQAALIIPQPGSSQFFYVFTTDDFQHNLANGFRYSMVDICADNGLGDVIPNQKNILVLNPVAEKLTGVRHGNGTDYWVIVHQFYSDAFYAYHIESTGITDTVVSHVGSYHPILGVSSALGQLKASPDGQKLATVTGNCNPCVAEYFDFDKNTGIISNSVSVSTNASWNYYGVSFSPDNTKLYISCTLNFSGILQYDLTAGGGNSLDVIASQTEISGVGANFLGLQLATDGKIYSARSPFGGFPFLGVINNPNNASVACNYVDSAINLNGHFSNYGFPNFIDSYDYSNTTYNCQTGIDEQTSNEKDIVFPNPFELQLNIKTAKNELSEIILYDIASRKLLQQKFKNTVTLNTAHLAKGMYIYEVINNKGVIGKGKVVKE